MLKLFINTALIASLAAGAVGCESKAGTGAIVGGAGGAAVGGLIGSKSHARAGEGALIGAGVGAIGGALIGHSMDNNDEKSKHRHHDDKYAPAPQQAGRVSTSDVISWQRGGTNEDVIVDRIQRSGSIALSQTDERQLHDAGVSDRVIKMMRTYGS